MNEATYIRTDAIDNVPVTEDTPTRRKKKLTAHRAAYLIHSFINLKLSIIFAIVLISGALAVFSEEIDWLLYSEIRVAPADVRLDEGELFDRLKEARPDVGLSSFNTANDRERTAASAFMTTPGEGFKNVWINPYTGEITGETGLLTVGNFLAFLHTSLFMPLVGRILVNFFGIICLVGLVTGLISYRHFWKEFFTLPRLNKNLRVFLGDLHKFLGLWSLWFVLIMGVTGSWWFYHYPLVQYEIAPKVLPDKNIDPGLSRQDIANLGTDIPTPLTSKEIVAAVKAHDPSLVIHSLTPPEHNGMAYSVRGTKHELLTMKGESQYFVNPLTGDILGDRMASNLAPIERVDRAMHPLHYGTWGYSGAADLTVKAIWFLFGVAMSILAISGIIIFYKRTKSATLKILPERGIKRKAKKAWLIMRPWGGSMSAFKYVNWIFIAIVCFGTGTVLTLANKGTSAMGYQYTERQLGGWTISLNAIQGFLEADLDPINPGRQTTIIANVKEGNPAGIKFMYVNPKKPRTARAPGAVIHGSVGLQRAHLPLPENLKDNAELWLTIEDWQGNFHQTSWPIMPDGVNTIDTRKNDPKVARDDTNDKQTTL